jgi:hypothetical protein
LIESAREGKCMKTKAFVDIIIRSVIGVAKANV